MQSYQEKRRKNKMVLIPVTLPRSLLAGWCTVVSGSYLSQGLLRTSLQLQPIQPAFPALDALQIHLGSFKNMPMPRPQLNSIKLASPG